MINRTELDSVFKKCFFTEDELAFIEVETGAPAGAILVEGIVSKFGFHPDRLEEQRDKVRGWLDQLPKNFRSNKNGGGGWSFLNMVILDDGTQWGEQRAAEQLMCLGIGLDMVKIQLPREMWDALPGGMPYLEIKAE